MRHRFNKSVPTGENPAQLPPTKPDCEGQFSEPFSNRFLPYPPAFLRSNAVPSADRRSPATDAPPNLRESAAPNPQSRRSPVETSDISATAAAQYKHLALTFLLQPINLPIIDRVALFESL